MFKIRIRKHEIGLAFRHGDFVRPLAPGVHWFAEGVWPFTFGRAVQVVDVLATEFAHKKLDVMLASDALRDQLEVVDLSDTQRALVWKDGRLGWILGPGRHAFWKRPYALEVEVFDVAEFELKHPKIEAILGHPGGSRFLDGVRVEPHERVLLFREGELVGQLEPGMHVYWKQAGKIVAKRLDLREQVADVSGQEIMTADKVTLRVNMVVTYQVIDPVKAVTVVADEEQALYREAQLALREAVGVRALDKLLTDKDAVGREVRDMLLARAKEFGVEVRAVGLRDVILPGEMKSILNQVIEAQKQAEANLIRRREETAAARSQANTAKLLADNPQLARMKELESLQEILRGSKATFVLGQGDVVDQVARLVTRDADE
jgi:regulator of protease activity HflC (stomatin/prohibitin superfamily)